MSFSRRSLMGAAALPFLNVKTAKSSSPWRPTRPVTCVIPFTPGGAIDSVFRSVQNYAETQRITLVGEYRPGAEGLIGMRAGSNGATDGHSLTFGSVSTMSLIGPDGWDAAANHRLITVIRSGLFMIATGSNSGIRSLDDLIAKLRDPSQKISGGTATPAHRVVMEILLKSLEINDATIANYRGSAGVIQDLIGNHIQWAVMSGAALKSVIDNRSVRVLATDRRLDEENLLPNTPSIFDKIAEFPRFDGPIAAMPLNSAENAYQFWLDFFNKYVNDAGTKSNLPDDFSISVPFGPEFFNSRIETHRRILPNR